MTMPATANKYNRVPASYKGVQMTPDVFARFVKIVEVHSQARITVLEKMVDHLESLSVLQQAALIRGETSKA